MNSDRLLAALKGMIDIEDSVTQGQERELREKWIPITRALVTEAEREAAELRKKNILAEGTITVTGTYRKGSPENRNPLTGGWPEEPAEIEDFTIICEVAGVEFEPDDKTLRKIEAAVIDDIETPEYARDSDD